MEEHLAIKLDSVTKEYPGVTALKNVSLNIKAQSIHGFLGPNGAGKSTTMKIISGLIPPTSGSVEVMGIDVQKNQREICSLIGYLPENPPLYKNMKVKDFLEFVYKINSYERESVHQALERVLDTCGLRQVAHRLVGHLSKGYQQRVGMAQALIYNPPILIFDEPTVGLDPKALDEIRALIVALSNEHTIMLSTHLLHEVSLICTDISIINQGAIVKEGTIQEVQGAFEKQQTFVGEISGWSTSIEQKLRASFQVVELDVKQQGDHHSIRLGIAEKSDQRGRLTKFFFENNCDVFSFGQEKMDIEDIFKISTTNTYEKVMQ